MAILFTGGSGYIGSHTDLSLLESGYELIIIDNLSNSYLESIERLQKLVGKSVKFYIGDVRNGSLMQDVFTNHYIESVLHFAGLKSVDESVRLPVKYYDNNVVGTVSLLRKMMEI